MHGKDGWLFLDHDSNHVVDQHSGRLRLSATDLLRWQWLLESRTTRLQELDIPYVFMVSPDAHSVYPEKLPDHVERSPARPVLQLIDHLAWARSTASVIYPLEELLAVKSEQSVYPRTGTHWNHAGAFIAYTRLATELDKVVSMRRVTEDQISFEQKLIRRWPKLETDFAAYENDLGVKVGPRRVAEYLVPSIQPSPQARLVSDNCVAGRGARVVLQCSTAPAGTCLLVGDSSSLPLVSYLAESFRRLVFTWNSSLDFGLIRHEQPAIVINLMTERFLVQVPCDSDDSTGKLEREKRHQRRLRRPLRYWSDAIGPASSADEPTSTIATAGDKGAVR